MSATEQTAGHHVDISNDLTRPLHHMWRAACTCGWEHLTQARVQAQAAGEDHVRPGPGAALVPVGVSSIAPAQRWTDEQKELIRQHIAPDCDDEQLAYFAQVCRHRRLDPFAGEIIAKRYWNKHKKAYVLVITVTVAGLRSIAEQSGLYGGQDQPYWCGPDGVWCDVWFGPGPPAAAKVAVYRKDWPAPVVGIARYESYVKLDSDGQPENLWKTGPDFMLAKCAEAAAIKRAFSAQMSDAGVNVRELATPSRIAMEARAIGLDDHGRHELVAEVTGGRTDSTRDLGPGEVVEVRGEIARRAAKPIGYVDRETGEIHVPDDVPQPEGLSASPPDLLVEGPTPPASIQPPVAEPQPDPKMVLIGRLAGRHARLNKDRLASIRTWMAANGLTPGVPMHDYTLAQLEALDAELDRRDAAGWADQDEPF